MTGLIDVPTSSTAGRNADGAPNRTSLLTRAAMLRREGERHARRLASERRLSQGSPETTVRHILSASALL